jgi:hypothetical protein
MYSVLKSEKKLKCTLVQALRLCTGRTAHRGSRVIAIPFLDYDTRRGWGDSVTPQPLFTPGKNPVQEAGWVPAPVWTGTENLASTGIRSPDRQARNHSLFLLHYPAHYQYKNTKEKLYNTNAVVWYNKMYREKQLSKNWTNDDTSNFTHF